MAKSTRYEARRRRPVDPAIGAALRRRVAAADTLVGASEFAVMMFDAFEGRRLYSNAAFDRLVGYDGREVLGKLPPYRHWVDAPRSLGQLNSTLDDTFAANGVRAIATRFRHTSGREFDVIIRGIALRRGSDVIGYLALVIELDALSEERTLRVLAIGETLRAVERAMEPVGLASMALRPHTWDRCAVPLLTPREQQVASMIGGGLRVASIARRLGVSVFTVRNHLKRVYSKLGVRSQAELVERLEAAGHRRASD